MENLSNILYLDDDRENLIGFAAVFGKKYNIYSAQTISEARNTLQNQDIQVALVDFKMPEMDGVDFTSLEQKKYPDVVFIIISAYADISVVIKAINQHNIYGFIQKPWNFDEVSIMLKNATKAHQTNIENKSLVKELKKKNNQLETAYSSVKQANKLKRVFLENLSHEIRTPLNAIIGFSQLIKNTTNPDKLCNYSDTIINGGYNLLKIVDSIMEGSKLLTSQIKYKIKPVNAGSLLRNSLEKAQSRFENPPVAELDVPKETFVMADELRLNKVFENIIENACKFTPGGRLKINTMKSSEFIHFFFIDNGKGISEKTQEYIFEPFIQGSRTSLQPAEGIGLGLFIARKHIENMNGKIDVKSAPDKGTTFTVSIPITPKAED